MPMAALITMKSALFIFLWVTLVHGDNSAKEIFDKDITITKANFFDPCYKENFCFFLHSKGGSKQKITELGPCENNNKFCMKVNMKPASEDCSKFAFEIAAVNLDDEEDWIAVAFRQDTSDMEKNLLVYCKGSHIFRGIIVDKENNPGDVTVEWSEKPTLTGGSLSDGLLRCSFTTPRIVGAEGGGVKIRSMDFASGNFNMLMAHGPKASDGDNFNEDDQHGQAGRGKLDKVKLTGCSKAPPMPEPVDDETKEDKGIGNAIKRSRPLNIITTLAFGIIILLLTV